jgi:hypothetical protein
MMQSAHGAPKARAGLALIESRATVGGLYLGEVLKLPRGVASDVLPVPAAGGKLDGGETGTFGYGGLEFMPSRWSTVVAMPCAARRLTLLAVYHGVGGEQHVSAASR